MYVIKDEKTSEYARHIRDTTNTWEMTKNINNAQHFSTKEWANEVAFWHLDHTEKCKWVIVDRDTGEEYPKIVGKYHP